MKPPAANPCGPPLHPQVELRAPSEVMRLGRMGSFFPTRMSFMRSAIRLLAAEKQTVERPVWEIDDEGYGHAVYSLGIGEHRYSLVAFSTQLDPSRRTDRVIAEAWDSSYVLYDGVPSEADIYRLRHNAPRQEAGRFTARELVLSRANKSLRLFEHVADALSNGHQPDEKMIRSIGYLMRTTAVYGNGKFGIADRLTVANRPHLADPFRPELLTVWLIRAFTLDLVQHVARRRNPDHFVPLDRRLQRFLGVGNSTGLGMAPFLVSHPILINNWMLARETALARVRAIADPSAASVARMRALIERAAEHLEDWTVVDARQMERISVLRSEWAAVLELVDEAYLGEPSPWDRFVRDSGRWSLECQELIVALLLEPHGELIDGLTECMASTIQPRLDPAMSTADLADLIATDWDWATKVDYNRAENSRQFWYVSEDKEEPRLGLRYEEPGAELEGPLDVARRVQDLQSDLSGTTACSVAEFLGDHPHHRFACTRVQTLARYPYAEIRDNLIGDGCLPIDMLRSKLSFFGASKFDPRSDRWTRITLYQGAPLIDELDSPTVDDWWLPTLAAS